MADMQSPQHPLEVLPAMLNMVLMQTANVLRDPERRNPKQAGLTRRRITEIVTMANQRYHDALDEIEVEILRAKAVMERDLRLIKRQRDERDCANGILVDPSPPKEADEIIPTDSANGLDSILMDLAGEHPEGTHLPHEQVTDPVLENSKAVDVDAPEDASQEAVTAAHGMPQDSENSVGLAITIPAEDTTKALEQPKSPGKLTEAEAPIDGSLEMQEGVDLDFESMFNDTDPKAIDDALKFDFGLSTEPAVAQGLLNDNNFNDISMTNTDLTNLPSTTNEDIDSLLPGVENYLNADTDFSNITIPLATTLPEVSQPAVANTTEARAQNAPESLMVETSFDDNFFGLGNFDMSGTGGDELGDGTLGDLEDFDWS